MPRAVGGRDPRLLGLGANPPPRPCSWFLNLDPSIKHGLWSPEEDQLLLDLQSKIGGRWSVIAREIEGRTENSVKSRFHSLQKMKARDRSWAAEEVRDA